MSATKQASSFARTHTGHAKPIEGSPAGALVGAEGKLVYHMGDTAIFGDLRLIGEIYRPDVALVPIGGFYTMGPTEAAKAMALLRPRYAIPMHYGTWPIISQSPEEFAKALRRAAPRVKPIIIKPGESFEL